MSGTATRPTTTTRPKSRKAAGEKELYLAWLREHGQAAEADELEKSWRKGHKWHAIPTDEHGHAWEFRERLGCGGSIFFASTKEYKRWALMSRLAEQGAIANLRRQVRYKLVVNGVAICTYVADLVYDRDGATVVEDTKGARTGEYRIKKQLMLACHNIAIQEI